MIHNLKDLLTIRWILIKEKLPEIDKYVLWRTVSGNHFVECLDKDGWFWLNEDKQDRVTHWMTIPELIEEK